MAAKDAQATDPWYLEQIPDMGCPAGCECCPEHEPGCLALRYRDPDDGHSFEVAQVRGGGVAEERIRELLSHVVQDGKGGSS